MTKTLEIIVQAKTGKQVELGQTLKCLVEKMHGGCLSLDLSKNSRGNIFTLAGSWKDGNQLIRTIESDEFFILTGALHTLGAVVEIHVNDETLKKQIVRLIKLKSGKILFP